MYTDNSLSISVRWAAGSHPSSPDSDGMRPRERRGLSSLSPQSKRFLLSGPKRQLIAWQRDGKSRNSADPTKRLIKSLLEIWKIIIFKNDNTKKKKSQDAQRKPI